MRPGPEGVWNDLIMCLNGSQIHDLLAQVMPVAPSKMLEVGSGSGKTALFFANAGSQVTMLDPDPEMRDYSQCLGDAMRALARTSGKKTEYLRMQWVDGDARNLVGHADDSYDFVFNEGLIEHFEPHEQAKILGEMARVSRTWVSLVFPDARVQENWDVHAKIESNYHGFDHGHEKPLTPEEWRSLFGAAGLEIVLEATLMRRLVIVVARKRGALEVRG